MRGMGRTGYIHWEQWRVSRVLERERYLPTAEQFALAAAMSDALEALLPIARLHACTHETEATWSALVELGLFGMSRAEDQGGSGLGLVEEALVAFELGRRLVSPAVLATFAGGAHLALSDGEAVAAAWTERGRTVLVDEPSAARVLLRNEEGGRLIARPTAGAVLDETHWAARLLEIEPSAGDDVVLDPAAMARVRLVDAAALAGLATTALEMAVAYAGFREQFGRPIGSFQAVKHHCANMALSARSARDLALFAASALAEGGEDAVSLVDSALVVAGTAAVENAGLNVQIHGGVGFSDEADPHLLVKRARLYLSATGGLDAAVARIAEASL
jgi:alkylation response protein AidB-like acyl-CoA dehydrogenase